MGLILIGNFLKVPKEMQNLGFLLDEWRAEVQKEARSTNRSPLLLTAAVYFSVDFFLAEVHRSYPCEVLKPLGFAGISFGQSMVTMSGKSQNKLPDSGFFEK
ncbi:hypothetical protein F0562_009326 [Nyssa sinensis]|uniref:Uncharacterized protein n=1 Tax=Nyssa sinensis TaxID=561372 RepID=A0A5J4ZVM9_9ASTE|nr:hypothetical protein F0562_009326 [Nyssa sinensis]